MPIVSGLRFAAACRASPILKNVLRERDEANDDLLVLGEGEKDEGPRLCFDWWWSVRRYKRKPLNGPD